MLFGKLFQLNWFENDCEGCQKINSFTSIFIIRRNILLQHNTKYESLPVYDSDSSDQSTLRVDKGGTKEKKAKAKAKPSSGEESVTAAAFLKFLQTQQKDSKVNIHQVKSLFESLNAISTASQINDDGVTKKDETGGDSFPREHITKAVFINYILSDSNDAFDPLRGQWEQDDMTQPLCSYWINSSHDTYLNNVPPTMLNNKFNAPILDCPVNVIMYANALYRGCRCLEIDVWDGEGKLKGQPVIKLDAANSPRSQNTYSNGVVDKKSEPILFSDVVWLIRSFLLSNPETLPIILFIENHCSLPNQERMAKDLKNSLGSDRMVYIPKSQRGDDILPSPDEMRGKAVIKFKIGETLTSNSAIFDDYDEDNDVNPFGNNKEDMHTLKDEDIQEYGIDNVDSLISESPHNHEKPLYQLEKEAKVEVFNAKLAMKKADEEAVNAQVKASRAKDFAHVLLRKANMTAREAENELDSRYGRQKRPPSRMSTIGNFIQGKEDSYMEDESVFTHGQTLDKEASEKKVGLVTRFLQWGDSDYSDDSYSDDEMYDSDDNSSADSFNEEESHDGERSTNREEPSASNNWLAKGPQFLQYLPFHKAEQKDQEGETAQKQVSRRNIGSRGEEGVEVEHFASPNVDIAISGVTEAERRNKKASEILSSASKVLEQCKKEYNLASKELEKAKKEAKLRRLEALTKKRENKLAREKAIQDAAAAKEKAVQDANIAKERAIKEARLKKEQAIKEAQIRKEQIIREAQLRKEKAKQDAKMRREKAIQDAEEAKVKELSKRNEELKQQELAKKDTQLKASKVESDLNKAKVDAKAKNDRLKLLDEELVSQKHRMEVLSRKLVSARTVAETAASEAQISEQKATEANDDAKQARAVADVAAKKADDETKKEEEKARAVATEKKVYNTVVKNFRTAKHKWQVIVDGVERVQRQIKEIEKSSEYCAEKKKVEKGELDDGPMRKKHKMKIDEKFAIESKLGMAMREKRIAEEKKQEAKKYLDTAVEAYNKQQEKASEARDEADSAAALAERHSENADEEKEAADMRLVATQRAEATLVNLEDEMAKLEMGLQKAQKQRDGALDEAELAQNVLKEAKVTSKETTTELASQIESVERKAAAIEEARGIQITIPEETIDSSSFEPIIPNETIETAEIVIPEVHIPEIEIPEFEEVHIPGEHDGLEPLITRVEKKRKQVRSAEKAYAKAMEAHQWTENELDEAQNVLDRNADVFYKEVIDASLLESRVNAEKSTIEKALSAYDRYIKLNEVAKRAKVSASKCQEIAAEKEFDLRRTQDYAKKKSSVHPICADLSRMTLLHGVKFKYFEKSKVLPFNNTHSLSEGKLVQIYQKGAHEMLDLIKFNKTHITRVFPSKHRALRTQANNYNPVQAWSLGCQVASMNQQLCDAFVLVNDGRFRVNGSCGYVLKPEMLTERKGRRIRQAPVDNLPRRWNIKILSGYNLPKPRKKAMSGSINPRVRVTLYDGGSHSPPVVHVTETLNKNGLNPIWDEVDGASFKVKDPSTAVILFSLWDAGNSHGGDEDFIAAAAIPVSCMRQGYRSIPLFDANNFRCGSHAFTMLFARIDAK